MFLLVRFREIYKMANFQMLIFIKSEKNLKGCILHAPGRIEIIIIFIIICKNWNSKVVKFFLPKK